ncbi:restriction endonuclease type II-like protein [Gautieria morchelliformis]|nr:restriction endonuclease type II-like protein [Gautieria morchelliformis]
MTSRPGPSNAPPVIQPSSGNAIIINSCQRLNPLLDLIRNVAKEFGDIVPDFEVGRTTGVLYLSLKYHRLHPEYIHQRIEKLGHRYNLRILLIVCDISEHQDPIRELTKTCLINNITIIVSWTNEEAALYLSTFKQYEHKPPDIIKERVDKDYASIFRSALTSIKGINKTDVQTLRSNCGSFAGISRASEQTLLDLPGFAQTKVRRLRDTFHKPFHNSTATSFSSSTFKKSASSTLVSSSHGSMEDKIPEEQEDASVASNSTRPRPSPPARSPSILPVSRPRPPRSPSPIWDIELDLNDSPPPSPEVLDNLPARKKHKADHVFGNPDSILASE